MHQTKLDQKAYEISGQQKGGQSLSENRYKDRFGRCSSQFQSNIVKCTLLSITKAPKKSTSSHGREHGNLCVGNNLTLLQIALGVVTSSAAKISKSDAGLVQGWGEYKYLYLVLVLKYKILSTCTCTCHLKNQSTCTCTCTCLKKASTYASTFQVQFFVYNIFLLLLGIL